MAECSNSGGQLTKSRQFLSTDRSNQQPRWTDKLTQSNVTKDSDLTQEFLQFRNDASAAKEKASVTSAIPINNLHLQHQYQPSINKSKASSINTAWTKEFKPKIDSQSDLLVNAPAESKHENKEKHQTITDTRGAYLPFYASLNTVQRPQLPLQSQLQQNAPQLKHAGALNEISDQAWKSQFALIEREIIGATSSDATDMHSKEKSEQNIGDYEAIWHEIQRIDAEAAQEAMKASLETEFEDYSRPEIDDPHPNFGEYKFELENPFMNSNNALEQGKAILEKGGNLTTASLAFEAAVQQSNGQSKEAWKLLGYTQSSNEKEIAAIRALERAVELDNTDMPALMSLAVSYINESYDSAAFQRLEEWLNLKYPIIARESPDAGQQNTLEDPLIYEKTITRVINKYLNVIQQSSAGQASSHDADLQIGLGALLYANGDFEKAIDCFKTALTLKPRDHLLWNRLGAALANSKKNAEALRAYEEALRLQPNFIRAQYNIAITCINIGTFEAAAKHLLNALLIQEDQLNSSNYPSNTTINVSQNLWQTLRRVLDIGLKRPDLVEKAHHKGDLHFICQAFGISD